MASAIGGRRTRVDARAAAALSLVVFDFDGVFTDNTVWTDQDGRESVRCWRSDGLGLKKLADANLPVWVLSTEQNPVVAARCRKLKIPCRHGLERKEDALRDLAAELIDRKLMKSAAYVLTLAVLTFFGIIHSATPDGNMYVPNITLLLV